MIRLKARLLSLGELNGVLRKHWLEGHPRGLKMLHVTLLRYLEFGECLKAVNIEQFKLLNKKSRFFEVKAML